MTLQVISTIFQFFRVKRFLIATRSHSWLARTEIFNCLVSHLSFFQVSMVWRIWNLNDWFQSKLNVDDLRMEFLLFISSRISSLNYKNLSCGSLCFWAHFDPTCGTCLRKELECGTHFFLRRPELDVLKNLLSLNYRILWKYIWFILLDPEQIPRFH